MTIIYEVEEAENGWIVQTTEVDAQTKRLIGERELPVVVTSARELCAHICERSGNTKLRQRIEAIAEADVRETTRS